MSASRRKVQRITGIYTGLQKMSCKKNVQKTAQDDFATRAAELHKLGIELPIWSFVQIKVQQSSILLPIKCPSLEKPLF